MSNPLSGLLGHYGDSDDDSDEEMSVSSKVRTDVGIRRDADPPPPTNEPPPPAHEPDAGDAAVHPAPIPHCPWSACYDEGTGFTYYWNQSTNAVTWEAPAEYLLAVKLAQQQMHVSGSAEVSAEEWQLYQQALAEKQGSKVISKPPRVNKPPPVPDTKPKPKNGRLGYAGKKRKSSDSDDEKIELITSYHHSDSESNDEKESPVKVAAKASPPKPAAPPKTPKPTQKKQRTKPAVEYGPSLPPNVNYSVPIGPELPPQMVVEEKPVAEIVSEDVKIDDDEVSLLKKLKDKTKLLEKLGGEIPNDVQDLIKNQNDVASRKADETSKDSKTVDTNIDDFLEEIEQKEFRSKREKLDIFSDNACDGNSRSNTPKLSRSNSPTKEVPKLFPSSENIKEETPKSLFPSAVHIEPFKETEQPAPSEKKDNIYLTVASEPVEKVKKKLKISNSVLPDKKVSDVPSYTTKYSQVIDGFSGARTGLGFSQANDDDGSQSPKKPSFVKGKIAFTKGETLHEDKSEELEDSIDLLEAKLKFLNDQQPYTVTPIQEMTIQFQTLVSAHTAGGLSSLHLHRWLRAAAASVRRLEDSAAPAGWLCRFSRSAGRYEYVRSSDGRTQLDYPAEPGPERAEPPQRPEPADDDMDISNTPPHAAPEDTPSPPPLPPPPPPPAAPPPPPAWDPPPPGVDDVAAPRDTKTKELGDELSSFYNDIAALDPPPAAPTPAPAAATPHAAPPAGPPAAPPAPPATPATPATPDVDTRKEKDAAKSVKKKSKVKISSSVGLKHKSVSSLVAKWQQVAEEID